MKLLPELVLLAVLLSQQVSTTEGFQIAAFNIQQLGLEKIRTARFATALANFICSQDWDILFLQELTSRDVLDILRQTLNAHEECAGKGEYSEVHSDQLPAELLTASGKEIYAYLYRGSNVSNFRAEVHQEQINQYQVNGQNFPADVFFRPPFVAEVDVNTQATPEMACMPKFILIGIHTKPVRTYSELNGLVNVYNWVRRVSENALILGDLNADCGTFGPVEKQKSILYNAGQYFKWLVNDTVKTNPGSATQSCAYDRLIAAGRVMREIALEQNVQVPQWSGLRLSDHWPVSIDLRCPPRQSLRQQPTELNRMRDRRDRSPYAEPENSRSRSRYKRRRSPSPDSWDRYNRMRDRRDRSPYAEPENSHSRSRYKRRRSPSPDSWDRYNRLRDRRDRSPYPEPWNRRSRSQYKRRRSPSPDSWDSPSEWQGRQGKRPFPIRSISWDRHDRKSPLRPWNRHGMDVAELHLRRGLNRPGNRNRHQYE